MNKSAAFYALLATALVAGVFFATQENKNEFESWKSKFGMNFAEAEDLYRSIIFHRNLDIIRTHNSNEKRTYDMGLNQFSALTDE